MTEPQKREQAAQAETQQAMLRATIVRSGEMIAEAERLIATSRNEGAGLRNQPANLAS